MMPRSKRKRWRISTHHSIDLFADFNRLPALQKLLDPANGEKTYEDDY